MAEAENTLSAAIDLGTAKAFQNISSLVEALIDVANQTDKFGQRLDESEQRLNKVARATKDAEESAKKLGQTNQQAGETVEKLGETTEQLQQKQAELAAEYKRDSREIVEGLGLVSEQIKNDMAVKQQATDAEIAATRRAQAARDMDIADQQAVWFKHLSMGRDYSKQVAEDEGNLSNIQGGIIGQVQTMVIGYLGMQSVVKVLDVVESRFRAIAEAQALVVNTAIDIDTKAQSFVVNMGLTGPDAQQRAVNLMDKFNKAAPGSTNEQIQGIVAAGSAFGASAENKGDFDLMAEVARAVAPIPGFGRQGSASLVKVMQEQGQFNKHDAGKFLSQFMTLVQRSPVVDKEQLPDALLRSILPLTQQGMSMPEAMGMFVSASAVEPQSMRAAQLLTRFTQLASGGTDPKSQQAIVDTAKKSGLLDTNELKLFDDARQGVMSSMKPADRDKLETLNRNLAEVHEKQKVELETFTEHMKTAQEELKKRKESGKGVSTISDRIADMQREHDQRVTEFSSREFELSQQTDTKMDEDLRKAVASTYLALPISERLRIFEGIYAKGKTVAQREQLLRDVGATAQESQAARRLLSPEVVAQGQQTQAAVESANPNMADQAGKDFGQTDVAQATARDQSRQIQLAKDSNSSLFDTEQFFKDVDVDIAGTVSKGDVSWQVIIDKNNGFFAATNDQYKLAREIQEAIKQMSDWWSGLDPRLQEELTKSGNGLTQIMEWRTQLLSGNGVLLPGKDAYLRHVLNQFFALRNWASTRASEIKKADALKKGAGSSAPPAVQRVSLFSPASLPARASDAAAMASTGIPTGGATMDEVSPIQGSRTANASGGGIHTHYNVNIGMLVSHGGDSLDLPSPLEGQT